MTLVDHILEGANSNALNYVCMEQLLAGTTKSNFSTNNFRLLKYSTNFFLFFYAVLHLTIEKPELVTSPEKQRIPIQLFTKNLMTIRTSINVANV